MPFQRIDCEVRNLSSSWACYLVFKDRAALCFPAALCYRSAFQLRGLESTAGLHSLFEAAFSVKLLFFGASRPLLGFSAPRQCFGAFLPRGSGFYFSAAFPVNLAVSGFISSVVHPSGPALAPPVRLPSLGEGRGFYFVAALGVNRLRQPRIPSVSFSSGAGLAPFFLSRGAASTSLPRPMSTAAGRTFIPPLPSHLSASAQWGAP